MTTRVKGAGRRRLAGWCLGLGFGGFFSQGILAVSRLFGTAQTVARPEQGFVYTMTDHNRVFFVSAGVALMNCCILVFWGLAAIGILVAPKQPGNSGRRRAIDDPDGTVQRGTFVGLATVVVLRLCATPLAESLIRLGWLHL